MAAILKRKNENGLSMGFGGSDARDGLGQPGRGRARITSHGKASAKYQKPYPQ